MVFFFFTGERYVGAKKNCVLTCSASKGEHFRTQKFFAPTYRSPDCCQNMWVCCFVYSEIDICCVIRRS